MTLHLIAQLTTNAATAAQHSTSDPPALWITSVLIPLVVALVTTVALQPLAWHLKARFDARRDATFSRRRRRVLEDGFKSSAKARLQLHPCKKHPDRTVVAIFFILENRTDLSATIRLVSFLCDQQTRFGPVKRLGTRFVGYFLAPSQEPTESGGFTAILPPHTGGLWELGKEYECVDGTEEPIDTPEEFTGVSIHYEFTTPSGRTENAELVIKGELCEQLATAAHQQNVKILKYWEQTGRFNK